MLVKMWSTDNSYALSVGGYNGRIILENASAVSYKIKHIPALRPSNSVSRYLYKKIGRWEQRRIERLYLMSTVSS